MDIDWVVLFSRGNGRFAHWPKNDLRLAITVESWLEADCNLLSNEMNMKTFIEGTGSDDCHAQAGQNGCLKPSMCPLSLVRAGMKVRIKELSTPPDVTQHLREIGFGEEQVIRLVIRQSNLICQVCNARLALSSQLAQMIMVELLAA